VVLTKYTLGEYGFLLKDPPSSPEFNKIATDLSPMQLAVVANRVSATVKSEELIELVYNNLNLYKDIELLKDVYVGADLIVSHINKGSRIGLVTDYDSDGINSAVVLTKTMLDVFKIPKEKVVTIINKRKNGNGFNKILIDTVLTEKNTRGLDIIICADHGSSDNIAFKVLKEAGLDIVLTDHHQIPESNYPAYADVVINNQRADSYFSKDVSGCCVAFITMLATFEKLYGRKAETEFDAILPYVCISTVTDVMALNVSYNRHLIASGLNEINSYRNKTWAAIFSALGISGKITYKDIGFKIGPLINTGNRLDCEELVFELLMEKEHKQAFQLALKLSEFNDYRKEVTKKLHKHIIANYEHDDAKVVVCVTETDIDVKGIIATKVGLMLGKTCVCFTEKDTKYSGSARGIVYGVNVHDALTRITTEHPGIICIADSGQPEYGGHEGAAGVNVYKDKLDAFKEAFNTYISEQLSNIVVSDTITVDAIIKNVDITPNLPMVLDVCGPYGKDWEKPLLISTFKLDTIINMGSICKIMLRCDNGAIVEGFHFFNTIGKYTAKNIKEFIHRGDEVVVSYNVDIERYNDVYGVSITINSIEKIRTNDGD